MTRGAVVRRVHAGSARPGCRGGQAWAKNVGWRIDVQLATPGVAARARREHIYLDQRFSDHAPLVIDHDAAI